MWMALWWVSWFTGVGQAGVIVEEVQVHGSGREAGLRPGDHIRSWYLHPADGHDSEPRSGVIGSIFEFWELEFEQAPRGDLFLRLRRDGKDLELWMPPGRWYVEARPFLAAEALAPFQAALASWREGREDSALEAFKALAESWRERGFRQLAAWLFAEEGRYLMLRGRKEEALVAYAAAVSCAENLADPLVEATLWEAKGSIHYHLSQYDAARRCRMKAMTIREQYQPESLGLANAWIEVGATYFYEGDLAAAEEWFLKACDLRDCLAAGSVTAATGRVYLGAVAQLRGQLALAEVYHRRAYEVQKRRLPVSKDLADTLANLGEVALARGHCEAALDFYTERLDLFRALGSPNGASAAWTMSRLAEAHRTKGDLDEALRWQERAIALGRKIHPETEVMGSFYMNRGELELARGGADAEIWFRRAERILAKATPESLNRAKTLFSLGMLAADRGEPRAAQRLLNDALDLRERAAPGSLEVALTHHKLASLAHMDGAERLDHLQKALAALENQYLHLGGEERVQAHFIAENRPIYKDLIELHIQRGDREAAFAVLERFRARIFLAVSFGKAARAEPLPDVEAKRRALKLELSLTQNRLRDPKLSKQGLSETRRELTRLFMEWSSLDYEASLSSSTRANSVADSAVVLSYKDICNSLEAGTLLLSYFVGEQRTWLFVGARQQACRVIPLHVTRGELERRVARFRQRIGDWHQPGAQVFMENHAEVLFDLLLAPLWPSIATAERLLIIGDGPLHNLPFGALRGPAGETGERPYLIESLALSTAISATVYGRLGRDPSCSMGGEDSSLLSWVGFGNPRYDRVATDERALRYDPRVLRSGYFHAWCRGGAELSPLPHSEREIAAIAALYPGRCGQFLGERANETNFRHYAERAGVLHLSCHSVVDPDFPQVSALVLSPNETKGMDGFLQAWEIQEMRLRARLVVLSACDTAMGEAAGGEGLLSLARAFHRAGAPAVLASLWRVSDYSTAILMEAFYTALVDGRPKGEALRSAQLAMLHNELKAIQSGRTLTHPYFWAAFQLSGYDR